MTKNWRDVLQDSYFRKLESIAGLLNHKVTSSLWSTLSAVCEVSPVPFIVIGGIARSKYAAARVTNDIDILFYDEAALRNFKYASTKLGCKFSRLHACSINSIEIETLTPSFLNLPSNIAEYVFATALPLPFSGKGLICSVEALVALKFQRYSDTDAKDIYDVIKATGPSFKRNSIMPLLAETQKTELLKILDNLKFIFDDFNESTEIDL